MCRCRHRVLVFLLATPAALDPLLLARRPVLPFPLERLLADHPPHLPGRRRALGRSPLAMLLAAVGRLPLPLGRRRLAAAPLRLVAPPLVQNTLACLPLLPLGSCLAAGEAAV